VEEVKIKLVSCVHLLKQECL